MLPVVAAAASFPSHQSLFISFVATSRNCTEQAHSCTMLKWANNWGCQLYYISYECIKKSFAGLNNNTVITSTKGTFQALDKVDCLFDNNSREVWCPTFPPFLFFSILPLNAFCLLCYTDARTLKMMSRLPWTGSEARRHHTTLAMSCDFFNSLNSRIYSSQKLQFCGYLLEIK